MMLTTGWAVSAWLLLLLPPLAVHAAAGGFIEYKVGVLMTTKLDSPFDLERCGPAVDLALDMVNKKFLAHHRVRLKKVESSYPTCSGAQAPGLAAKMYFVDKVIAFIGPACAFALEPVARLAAFWNIPIITGMGDQPPAEGQVSVMSGILGKLPKWKNDSGIFKDKSEYPTLTRMSYCQRRLRLVFLSIFKKFNWKHVALIQDRSDLFSLTVGKNLEIGLRKAGVLSFIRDLDGNDEDPHCENYLKDASSQATVVILCVRGTLVRKCMLAAHKLGMTKGDWAFLDVELVQGSYWGEHGWSTGDSEDGAARKAYQALLRVSLLKPTSSQFHNFSKLVKQKALENYNYTLSENEEVNFFVGAFYDGVHLLGMAMNETLTNKQNIKDGKAITSLMWNRTFSGVTGRVRIDENGDRDADYAILDLDPITGRFEVVAKYYGEARNYSPVIGKHIHWPGGSDGPPEDVPACGFLGSGPACDSKDIYYIMLYALIAFTVFISFVTVLAFIVNRQLKLAADLNNMSWRVRPEEVLIEVSKPYSSRLALQKPTEIFEPALQEKLICRRRSDTSNSSLPPAQVYTTVGIYKGSRVAIKKVVKKKVDLNKKLLWEIKQVRDVTHENTVRFIGACIHCPTVLILTEYCPKGSLKDVLENDALRLDWNFRMSLIHDIVKGMAFLHSCEVGVHGKLRSSNCLIDGRFVLKLSNFGLRTLTTPSEVIHDSVYYHKLLWVAPELLSEHTTNLIPATQKGDVYSFAIVLEEIVVRGGPYEFVKNDLTTQEILEKVELREEPYFRPDISGHDCPEPLSELIQRCWNDVPEERPGFDIMRSIVRQITRGYCENLMDDLVLRMEQYANNLEALVEEKTDQLSQEKRRSEELLFQVLPRPVAQQLMAGEMVKPEQFENVTVYFSDIVGFTVLCAQSSPMQVVNLLNDLYSTFDRIIGFYDVYKVETIGDAYMVVSGLPERNGDNHAKEIALMSLAILDAVQMFTIQHKPDAQLKVRIGIHTGPVCAGVVGQKMPHYCLFGDTVNTASRMESTGEPLRIHVSWATKHILDTFQTFKLELRGDVELKGKGAVVTYWLVGCTEQDPRPPTPISTDTLDPNNPYPLIFPELSK
ncbi:atrial natriuretic peptide receptor 1-like [Rhopalosiphum maidis]|uniref:atrial natriuretic peptide receptor 1-like n=1 Tax=Rhopalosiphum maidis TaxID=43146 RepID=UPI000F0002EF|nr:atrial natriuretic peptide receptor 1-like [Rhopalosiphum maidis]